MILSRLRHVCQLVIATSYLTSLIAGILGILLFIYTQLLDEGYLDGHRIKTVECVGAEFSDGRSLYHGSKLKKNSNFRAAITYFEGCVGKELGSKVKMNTNIRYYFAANEDTVLLPALPISFIIYVIGYIFFADTFINPIKKFRIINPPNKP